MSLNRFRFAAIAMIICWINGANTFGQKMEIRSNIQPGLSWSMQQVEAMDLNSTMKANGQSQQMRQIWKRRIVAKVEVLEAANGRATAARITFDKESGGQMEDGQGQKMPMPFSLAGKTVNAKLDGQGMVTHDAGQIPPPDEEVVASIMMGDDAFLPQQPVGVGDTWTPDMNALARKWQIDPNKSKMNVSLTLKDLKEAAGRRYGMVEFVMQVGGEMDGGMQGERKINGTAMIDLATGKIAAIHGEGTMTMSGMQQQQGQDGNTYVIQMESQGKLTTQAELVIGGASGSRSDPNVGGNNGGNIGGKNGGNNPGPGPIGGFTGGSNNNDRPAPGPGPGPATPQAGSFSFSDGTMNFSFDVDPNRQGIAGTIEMEGNKYPARITQWDGRMLRGTFEAGGSQFDFTGQLNGDTLTFQTGKTKYELKSKPAKKNPLER